MCVCVCVCVRERERERERHTEREKERERGREREVIIVFRTKEWKKTPWRGCMVQEGEPKSYFLFCDVFSLEH